MVRTPRDRPNAGRILKGAKPADLALPIQIDCLWRGSVANTPLPRRADCNGLKAERHGCEGAASGAGIRFRKAGIRGAGDPRRVVGLRTKPPRFANPPPCPRPPRAKTDVEARTQAAATNTAELGSSGLVMPGAPCITLRSDGDDGF
jgi:hypothetical protein